MSAETFDFERPRFNVTCGGQSIGITFNINEAQSWYGQSRHRSKEIREILSGQVIVGTGKGNSGE